MWSTSGKKKTYQLFKFIGDESCSRLPAIIFQKKKKSLTVTVHFLHKTAWGFFKERRSTCSLSESRLKSDFASAPSFTWSEGGKLIKAEEWFFFFFFTQLPRRININKHYLIPYNTTPQGPISFQWWRTPKVLLFYTKLHTLKVWRGRWLSHPRDRN